MRKASALGKSEVLIESAGHTVVFPDKPDDDSSVFLNKCIPETGRHICRCHPVTRAVRGNMHQERSSDRALKHNTGNQFSVRLEPECGVFLERTCIDAISHEPHYALRLVPYDLFHIVQPVSNTMSLAAQCVSMPLVDAFRTMEPIMPTPAAPCHALAI